MVYQEFCALPQRAYPLNAIPLYALPGGIRLAEEEPAELGGGGGYARPRRERKPRRINEEGEIKEMLAMILSSGILN